MKKINVAIIGLSFAGLLASCDTAEKNSVSTQVDEFGEYVDSVSQAASDLSAEKWADVKAAYNEQVAKLDAATADMKEDVQEEYREAKEQYARIESEYASRKLDNERRRALRTSLMDDATVNNDLSLSFVTADNILSYYKHFVETVEANQNDFTKEEWDEVKALYEDLDNRKNEVEDRLSSKDNMAIAKLKVKFSAIKTIKRPFAEKESGDDA